MAPMRIAWNRKKMASVMLIKIKEFTITQNTRDKKYSIKGWFNKENCFLFGDDFETIEIAQEFLEDIHKKM